MKHLIITLLLCLGFAYGAQASEQAARDFAEKTANEAVEVLSSEKSENAKVGELEKLFVKTVDTDWIGRFVLGKHWRDLDDAQQKSYLKSYQDFLVKHYTANFQEYTKGTQFEITRSKTLKKGQYMVSMDINRPTNPQPVKVDYRLREKSGKFGIIDIVVEGVSLLNTQRSEFSSVVQRKGVDHLIEQLKSRS